VKGKTMSDFKDFLERVLSPVRDDVQTEPEQVFPKLETKAESPSQRVPNDELERRYIAVMNELLADAQKHNAMNVFADVVSWKLAVVAHLWGARATGDILRKFGGHLATLTEAAAAQRESDAATKDGRRSH
jgi:hypothetical protein